MKKYKLLKDDQKQLGGATVFRIQALKDFGEVKMKERGGYIASEKNLSQQGDCWVAGDSRIYENAQVSENAWVFNTWLSGDTRVSGRARVSNTRISGNVEVSGNSWVCTN